MATGHTDVYRDLVESLDGIFWEADPETLQFTSVSPKAEALLGYPTVAWTSTRTFWSDILHPDDRQRARDTCMRAIKRCEGHSFEYRVIAADGSTRWVRDTVRLKCERGQPNRLYGVMVDVTASVEQREAHYRALLENSPDAVALLDRDGTVRFVTQSVERISGFRADELIGSSPLERVHPEHVPRVRKALEDCVLRPGNRVSVEYCARHNDGSWQHREVIGVNRLDDPAIRAIVVNYRDITDRKRMEGALVESERMFGSTFDEAPIGIGHTSLEGRWLRVNGRLCALLGYAPEELVATSFMAVTHPDDVEQDSRALTQLLAGAITKYEREKRYRHKNGHFVSAKLTAVLHRDSAGAPQYFIAIVEDVTERVRLEGELRHAQKMEAVGRLAAGVAHDFNNLLTAIVGFTELAIAGVEPRNLPIFEDLQAVLKAGRSAGSLTRQLLTFSRKQSLLPRVLDLNDIVRRMEQLLRRTIGEEIELVVRLTEPLSRISADPGQIEQVLMNLAINGRDAMPGGGTLTIETANVTCDEGYTAKHPGSSPGPHAMIAVTDTGIGMDQDVLAHLFEPFYTTKGVGQGTGLGLASVYGIVQQSGGSISVSSEVGCGSTFRIYFPDVAADVPVVPATAPVSLRGTETILLVEDQDDVRSIVRATLMRHGYTVVEAARPEIALRVAEEQSHFDLLLTDVVMPTMSGRDLARQFQQRRPALRVLYMSGYTDGAIVQHGMLDPSVAFIQKPFTPDGLLRKVREALDGRQS